MKANIGIIAFGGAAVALGAAGALAFSGNSEKPITVITSPAAVGDIESTVMATGTLEPANVVDVGAQTSGQIQALTVKVGDLVTKGEKIGQIDPTLLNNAVKSAQNTVNSMASSKISMQAQLGVAQSDLNRQTTLTAQGIGTPANLEASQARLKSAQASVASIETSAANFQLQLEAAQANLEKANIRSPIDGLVAEILINEGASVNNNNQVPVILRVAKMDMMTVRAQVSEADVMKIANGQKVYFTVLGEPDHRYYGKLRSLGFTPSTGQLDPSKGSAIKNAIYYNALLDLPNADGRLRPGMTANVYMVLGEARKVVNIPLAALGRQIDKTHYMVAVQDSRGQVVQKQVTTGISDKLNIEVKDGLKAGDKVVVGEVSAQGASASSAKQPMFALPASWKG